MLLTEIQQFDIKQWLKKMGIENYTIKDNGVVDVDGDNVVISYHNLTKIPIQFGYVDGDFNCGYNNLTSLQGGPREVGGDFYCGNNKFKSEPDHSFINIHGNFRRK